MVLLPTSVNLVLIKPAVFFIMYAICYKYSFIDYDVQTPKFAKVPVPKTITGVPVIAQNCEVLKKVCVIVLPAHV
jgi:hypothetical protein